MAASDVLYCPVSLRVQACVNHISSFWLLHCVSPPQLIQFTAFCMIYRKRALSASTQLITVALSCCILNLWSLSPVILAFYMTWLQSHSIIDFNRNNEVPISAA